MKRDLSKKAIPVIADEDLDNLSEEGECCAPNPTSFKMTGKFDGELNFINGSLSFKGKFDGSVESIQQDEQDFPPISESHDESESKNVEVKKLVPTDKTADEEESDSEHLSQASDEHSEEDESKKKHYDAEKLKTPPNPEDCKTQ
ncbi:hypothetical protein EIN_155020 [Entamoeba invadens IP1]|uniref:Uncharacterized protein n=1 Tax=Entamoeba invadens IP1 TaxID=370355 RepID=A0A0A1U913_ENTIV|nr:hypothetical protein EIN_155020 [Entamoeba invadens IP1]ELP91405.1 hypothetical protein EIN_155020 [Entamoeba invadens IP1]|eukprot:XP_004258176.1 hypothetical protein EIN_155020 [Entamoeba invadens IP1]